MNYTTVFPYLCVLITSGVGAFLGAFFKQTGKNLATRSDFDKMLDLQKIQAAEIENIKAAISDDIWDRQEQWKLKRDAILEAIRSIAAIKESMAALDSCFCASIPESKALEQKRQEERDTFKETNSSLWCSKFVAEVVVGTELNEYLYQFYQEAARIAGKIMNGDSSYFKSLEGKKALADKTNAVIRAARKELGIPDREDLMTPETDH